MSWWRLKQFIRSSLNQIGLDVTTCRRGGFPYDFEGHHIEIIKRVTLHDDVERASFRLEPPE